MAEQFVILFFSFLSIGVTIFLYVWKSKRETYYKNDTRWKLVKDKANLSTTDLYYLPVGIIGILQTISINFDLNLTITFDRLMMFSVYFIGLRNTIELLALKHFDNKI